MAVALGAVVFIPLTMAFNVAIKAWDKNTVNEELYQHARVAMDRLVSDVEHAGGLLNFDDAATMEIYTRNVVDENWDAEVIQYAWNDFISPGNYILYRSEDGSAPFAIAGSDYEPRVNVAGFTYTPYKWNDGSSDFEYFNLGDPVNDAQGILLALNVENADGTKSVTLVTEVNFRNK